MEKLVISRMDLVLTTRCSLKCESCANLMQYYEKSSDVSLEVIHKSMDRLLRAVDYIGSIYVLGGEPFLYRDLDLVLDYLSPNDNLGEMIVVTNGTICPPEENRKLWESLQNRKVKIRISDYGVLSRNIDLLVNQCEKHNVTYIKEEKGHFYDVGNMKSRKRTLEELDKVFRDCSTQCRSLFNGELHFCPRSAHGTDLGLVPKVGDNFVNLLQDNPSETIREEINNLINRKKYVEACDYCDIRTPGYYDRKIPLAKQTKYVLHV